MIVEKARRGGTSLGTVLLNHAVAVAHFVHFLADDVLTAAGRLLRAEKAASDAENGVPCPRC